MTKKSCGQRWILPILWRAVLLLGIMGLGLVWGACQQPMTPVADTEVGVTVDEILADPQQFLGKRVAADASVDRVLSERVIVLQPQTQDGEMLAILSDQAVQSVQGVRSGDTLHIVGTVQPLTRAQIQQVEQQLGITLDEEQLLSLAGQAPFVIVDRASR